MEILNTNRRAFPGEDSPSSAIGSASKYGSRVRQSLSFYQSAPHLEVCLEDFELFAVDRLRVLKGLEEALSRGKKNDEVEGMVNELWRKYMRTLNATDTKNKDIISHFVLRLVYCRTEELRRWFLQMETTLFRYRFRLELPEAQRMFMEECKLPYKAITTAEFEAVKDKLGQVARSLNQALPNAESIFFKVPFEEVPELVSNRRIFLQRGHAYVPMGQIAAIVVSQFRSRLSKALVLTNRPIPLGKAVGAGAAREQAGSGGRAVETAGYGLCRISTMATTSSASSGQSLAKDFDPNSPLWRHVTIVQQLAGGGCFEWKCNDCDGLFKGSYSRVKSHLCAITGNGIRVCKGKNNVGVPKAKVLAYIKEQEDAEANVAMRAGHPLAKRGGSSRSTRPPVAPSPSGSPIVAMPHPFVAPISTDEDVSLARKKSKTKGPLEKAFQNETRAIADEHIARCVYANGLSFNVVRSPYWHEMVKAINEAPKGYKSPGYEKIRTTLLDKQKKYVETSLQPIRDSWTKTGVSIVSDGWKDARNRPLINVIAVCPKGAMFLKAVDCEGQVKDAQFIANILFESIEAVGPENVVQVITDNAKNCKAAGMLVEARYGHIFWTPCAVHSLNLMLKKMANKIEWIQQVYEEAEEIQMFVTNHHMSQGIFRSFSQLELLKVAETRFASHTIVLRRLVKVREALMRMVTSNLWSIWRQSNTQRAQKVKTLILEDPWWDRVNYLLSFTEPIMSMIRFTDTDQPCLGEIYDGIDSMIEKIKAVINAKEQDPEEIFFKQVKSILIERWNKMTTPLHLLAFALTPRFYSTEILSLPGRVAPYRDAEVSEGYMAALARLFPDPEAQDQVMVEFGNFIAETGHSLLALRSKYKMDAHMWWYLHGTSSVYLQPLAIKVASSSSSERNWSTYSFIHSQKHNRLRAKRAEDLVYIHSNLRLLSHKQPEYKEGSTRHWDIDPEIVDLDASISHHGAYDDEGSSVALAPRDLHAQGGATGSGPSASGSSPCGSNEPHNDDDVAGFDPLDEEEYDEY
ncbi:hypothetical protein KI387_023111 [Taxus chinensis]|uniref:DUF659 domain-containing protein n=1 Tax=Taxus chinensis TaxID=29808 RepID=A0AA38G1H9_TAXCH|nr:hypothetical protein KI387_023111 [Taxus chinensis]